MPPLIAPSWSTYQSNIFDFIADPNAGNALVTAMAGSGKTTTIVEAIKHTPPDASTLFVAFNKRIADELGSRLPIFAQCRTLNSLGYSVVRENAKVTLDQYKTGTILGTYFNMGDRDERNAYMDMRPAVSRCVSSLKNSGTRETEAKFLAASVMSFIDNFSIDLSETEPEIVAKFAADTFLAGLDGSIIDFDDQVHWPLFNNWAIPTYDFVFVDECQDLNPVQIAFVERLAAGGRLIAVGDIKQAIYGFRGADPEALHKLQATFNATTLPLPITYRCPSAITRFAQLYVPGIEAAKQGGKAEAVKPDQFLPQPGDMVLCRFTAPLVEHCMELLSRGIKANVLGREIGTELANIIKKVDRGRNLPIDEFIRRLLAWRTTQLDKAGDNQGKRDSIADRVRAINYMIQPNTRDAAQLAATIADIFGEDRAGVTLSTVHKAKGLEAPTVWILKPRCLPYLERAKSAWQREQEQNLFYVAVTRAMERLVFVDDWDTDFGADLCRRVNAGV